VFRIRQDWFALPIQFAQRVIPLGLVYGAPQGGVSLTRYQDQEIPVIDVEYRVFGGVEDRPVFNIQRHLMIVQDAQGAPVGIPFEAQPTLRRVAKSAFAPVPAVYLAEGNIQCVSALIQVAEDEPPLFLLDLDQLLQRVSLAPAIESSAATGIHTLKPSGEIQ
jgi:chemotaxis signal transduction protein